MPYLNISRFTDPTPLRLLDASYILVLLPLLLVIKVPMIIYMLSIFMMLLMKKEITNKTLISTALFGVVALFLSLYGAFNYSGLSKLKIFIELLIYLLIVAITLQRMTRQVNFYLFVSPILLLALSLFFFHSIGMLIYVIFEIFMLLWIIFAHRMQGSWRENLQMSGMLFALSIPWVVLLFIFFPRISFEHASYGFREDIVTTTGHDGTMYIDNKALLIPSDRIVMEVSFMGDMPPANQLYFRGTVLYTLKKNHWKPLLRSIRSVKKSYPKISDDLILYKVALYPTKKTWLYLLDMPIEAPRGATIDADFVTTIDDPIEEPLHYEATSALKYSYGYIDDKIVKRASLSYRHSHNPTSLSIAHKIKKEYPMRSDRAKSIVKLFRDQNLTYSLKPTPLDLNNSVDSFLFDKKKGYCVYFASSFVLMARMSGIPARVVTGYRADIANSVENYIVVKERDAHAWAELLIDNRWVRFETTSFASTIEDTTATTQQNIKKEQGGIFGQLNLYLMYIKYQVESWIVEYSHFRQMQLLNEIKQNPSFLYKAIALFVALLLLSYTIFRYFHRPICRDRLLSAISPLLKILQKQGYMRQDSETMHQFFQRISLQHIDAKSLEEIDRLYEKIRYGGDDSEESLGKLKIIVDKFGG